MKIFNPRPKAKSDELEALVRHLEDEIGALEREVPSLEAAFKALGPDCSQGGFNAQHEERSLRNKAWADGANRLSRLEGELKKAKRNLNHWRGVDNADRDFAEGKKTVAALTADYVRVAKKREAVEERMAAASATSAAEVERVESLEHAATQAYAQAIAEGDEAAVPRLQEAIERAQNESAAIKRRAMQQQGVIDALASQREKLQLEQAELAALRDEAEARMYCALGAKYQGLWDQKVSELAEIGACLARANQLRGASTAWLFTTTKIQRCAPDLAFVDGYAIDRLCADIKLPEFD